MTRQHEGRQRRRLTATEVDVERVRQRALLVGTGTGTRDVEEAEESLAELARLADTAGADAVEVVLQRRDTPDPATYIGKGKAEELRELVERNLAIAIHVGRGSQVGPFASLQGLCFTKPPVLSAIQICDPPDSCATIKSLRRSLFRSTAWGASPVMVVSRIPV